MAKRFCPDCGSPLPEGARFCPKCRRPITQEATSAQVDMSGCCAGCGAPLIKGAAFCSKCRRPVSAPAQPAHNTAQAAQTVKKILEHTMNASNAPGEMRVSMNRVGGDQLFSVLGSILKGGGV